jgi:two-component system sensor histidine kinase MtrB
VVGSPVTVPGLGEYRLFQFFPLTAEQETLGLVRRTAAAAGLLLVALLGVITGLVARQVVAPVRAAASTAERLAAGRLDERLRVRGEDEIARSARASTRWPTRCRARSAARGPVRVQRASCPTSRTSCAPADDRPDGRRRPVRRREDFPAGRRARPSCCRPSSTASRRCSPTCWRSAATTRARRPRRQRDRPVPGRAPGARRRAPLAARHGSRFDLHLPPVRSSRRRAGARRAGLRNLVVNAVEHGEGRRSRCA